MEVFYTYDFTLNALGDRDLNTTSRGSHEITVGFFLFPSFTERNAEDTKDWEKR